MWDNIPSKAPIKRACSIFTACAKGKRFATFSNAPPTNSKSNQIPDNHAERLVNNAPQIPPTCLSLKTLPQRTPMLIYNKQTGIIKTRAYKMLIVISSRHVDFIFL